MPYEQMLIPHLEEIKLEFREALEDHLGYFNADDLPFMKVAKPLSLDAQPPHQDDAEPPNKNSNPDNQTT